MHPVGFVFIVGSVASAIYSGWHLHIFHQKDKMARSYPNHKLDNLDIQRALIPVLITVALFGLGWLFLEMGI